METCPVCNNPVSENETACPLCGFKLLGSTQRFVPVALEDEQSYVPSQQHQAKAMLSVVRGPQTGVAFTLEARPLSVGRSPQCDIFLNDMTVSRDHASIAPADGGFVISDKDSYNGVWVNNESVESHRLQNGDFIQIGAFGLVYNEE